MPSRAARLRPAHTLPLHAPPHAPRRYHNDSADIVTLLCLKNAKSGGLSSFSSSITVHNEILRRRPDLGPLMAGPWYFDRKGEVPPGKKPFFAIPVFNYHAGYLSVNYSDNYYLLSQRHAEVPRLTPAHYEAMALFNQLAASDELRLDMMLQPGEIQVLSNHTALHTRSAFEDWDDVDQRRHLLRLWLAPANDRPLPDSYKEIYGGGIEVRRGLGSARVRVSVVCLPFLLQAAPSARGVAPSAAVVCACQLRGPPSRHPWLTRRSVPPVPPNHAPTQIGNRGGIHVEGTVEHISLEAE